MTNQNGCPSDVTDCQTKLAVEFFGNPHQQQTPFQHTQPNRNPLHQIDLRRNSRSLQQNLGCRDCQTDIRFRPWAPPRFGGSNHGDLRLLIADSRCQRYGRPDFAPVRPGNCVASTPEHSAAGSIQSLWRPRRNLRLPSAVAGHLVNGHPVAYAVVACAVVASRRMSASETFTWRRTKQSLRLSFPTRFSK